GIGLVVVIAISLVYTILRKKIKASKETPGKVDSQVVRRIIREESYRKQPISIPSVPEHPRTQVIPLRKKGGTKIISQRLLPQSADLPAITLKGQIKLTVGRSGSDIIISNPKVSRRHASIHRAGDVIIVEDLGSTNGTFINGRKIPVHTPTGLELGKTIAFGSESMFYIVDGGASGYPNVTEDFPLPMTLVPESSDFPKITLQEGQRITVGRRLINNAKISRQHAILWMDRVREYPTGGLASDRVCVMVEDLGSTNGTYVHGHKLDPKSPMELKEGERLVFGSEEVVYYIR
ncbi:MAG: FHA domain-containing protein, partial [Candidatus Electryoneaceae bacterium]|nr:FHA domain-containing protein [Candidatus Electryoneaceae bacterium]